MKKMSMRVLSLTLALCLLLSMPAAAFGAAADNCVNVYIDATRYDSAAEEVLDLVNKAREEAGVPPLVLDSKLQEAAMLRAMESIISFSHTRPDGSSCLTAEPNTMTGENLAVNYGSPETVVEAWLASKQGHRENILHPDYNSVGIGCVKYKGVWFWSQAFARTEGNDWVPDGTQKVHQKIEVMPGLLNLTWTGVTEIDLGESEDKTYKVAISTVNPNWEHIAIPLENHLFDLESSDERVLKVKDSGVLTPVSAGTATITATLCADGDRVITQEIVIGHLLNEDAVSLEKTSYTYDGKAKEPSVTVDGLTEDDYIVSYKDNVKVGTATVTVTGVGDIAGTVTKTFKINHKKPDRVDLKKPTTGKSHYVNVRWYDEECDGYQIRYATNSSFKNSKSVYVKDGDDVSRKIKNLKKGKRYYVKVRAYYNYEDTKVFGKWSKWKSIVCK